MIRVQRLPQGKSRAMNPRPTAPLTERERRNLEMPENLREENAPPLGDSWAREGWEMGRSVWMGIAKRRKAMSGEGGGNHWANDIYGPGLDDPWNPRSPLDDD